jgi:hypothetical protein
VINSHLTFPHAEIYKDMRLDQIKLVLAQARDYIARENLDNVPVVRTASACHEVKGSAARKTRAKRVD